MMLKSHFDNKAASANQYSFQNATKNPILYDDSLFNLIDEI